MAAVWLSGSVSNVAVAAGPVGHPKVEVVAGRRAATFDGRSSLVATFTAPAAITGNHPFTAAVWAFNPNIAAEECMVQWARRGSTARCAQLNYGNSRSFGAVSHWGSKDDMGFDGGVPAAGVWHHIAVTYAGGPNGVETVWVDGEVNTTEAKTLNLWRGDPVRLGCSEKGHWFSGSLASVQIYDSALGRNEIAVLFKGTDARPRRALIDLDGADLSTGTVTSWLNKGSLGGGFGDLLAFNPSPKDKETLDDLKAVLRWSPGDRTVFQDIYVGTNKAEVEKARHTRPVGEAADSRVYRGRQSARDSVFGPISLNMRQTYFWRIDGVNKAGVVEWRGPVWSFTANTGQAEGPSPRNRVAGVPVATDRLTWTPGKFAVWQTLHFGDSYEEVSRSLDPTVRDIARDDSSWRISHLPLASGRTYYWRVDQVNGDLPFAKGEIWSFRTADEYVRNDVTFFVATDLHYGASETAAAANEATIDNMNSLPGTRFPADVGGGIVRTPRGILLTGDLTDNGAGKDGREQWNAFVADYGVNSEGRAAFPVYEGGGNHDGGPGSLVAQAIKARTLKRPAVKNVSSDGLNYSWDWDQVHCVQLNLYPGNERDKQGKLDGKWNDPDRSLDFLISDLKQNVGASGRSVFLLHHYGWDDFSLGWWSDNEREALYNAIRPYNIIGILYGHSHAARIHKWKGVDVFNVGAGQRDPNAGECFVFHVTDNEMVAAHRKSNGWGVTLRKPIATAREQSATP
jgi:hypothetical protein